ncbi:MAG: VWA domain-containing protein [Spirochaetales bacterium]|nr:VWA domain-containing protein [Spirochaetales bacterium]
MWTLEQPGFLLLLLILPAGIYFRHFYRHRGGRLPFSISLWRGARLNVPNRFMRVLLFVAETSFWTGVVLFIIALAGPGKSFRERLYLARGLDIMIVLDESPSMAAQDFQPYNRFETAKQVIRDFLSKRENDAVGLVSFSTEAALRVPPTVDRQAFLDRLDSLSIMNLGEGTAIGMGIAVAALHLERSSAERGIIVLLTDGENNTGEIQPESAAAIAASIGIRIYVIGIGSQGEVTIELKDSQTGKVTQGRWNSRFDEALLARIAETAGGRYFSAKSPGALASVFRTIDSLETGEKRSKTLIRIERRYHVFILAGLCCVFLEFLIRKGLYKEVFS